VQRGVAAEQSEHSRAEEGGVQAGAARNDVKVEVCEPLGFREQCYVGFLTLNDLPQCRCKVAEQRPEFSGLVKGQLIERQDVPAGDYD
jgi:hypothetical protein